MEKQDLESSLIQDFKKVEILKKVVDSKGDSSPETVRKHRLHNSWTLWYYKRNPTKQWEENQRLLITISNVEDFWYVYNHVEVASRLPSGSDYSFFKEGIFPAWEDRQNEAGGRWLVSLDRRQRATCLDSYWLEILLFMIGEQAGARDGAQVNGAVVNVRGKGDKLAVWLKDAEEESVRRIGAEIKSCLALGEDDNLGFNVHSVEKAQPGSSLSCKKYIA